MANTPFQDKGTQEIISPHINALQDAVKKIEQSLNMDTEAKVDQPLTLIEDTKGRFRIAQAVFKNWLADPAPVIQQKINDTWTTITEGFTVEYAGGALVFPECQQGEEFRASFTCITHGNQSQGGIAIGPGSKTGNIGAGSGDGHIAIGHVANTQADSPNSRDGLIAIGEGAEAKGDGCIAIGKDAKLGPDIWDSVIIGSDIVLDNADGAGYLTVLGQGAKIIARSSWHFGGVAVGAYAEADAYSGISIGYFARTQGTESVSVGYAAICRSWSSVAIGKHAETNDGANIAIGNGPKTGNIGTGLGRYHIAIGHGASTRVDSASDLENMVAIGYNATATSPNEFVLGNEDNNVKVPGNLIAQYLDEGSDPDYSGVKYRLVMIDGEAFMEVVEA